jgi:hypothetical protein
MRVLSPAARQAAFAAETAEAFIGLMLISDVGLEGPLRFANNTESIWSRAFGDATPQEFLGWPFGLVLPDERDDQIVGARLQIDNIDPRIMASVRPLTRAPLISLRIVLASTPDYTEMGPVEGRVAGVNYNIQTIDATVTGPPVLSEPFPARTFVPGEWRAVF